LLGDVVIGSPYLTLSDPAASLTAPGMADFADVRSTAMCGGCINFLRKNKRAKDGWCAEYSRRMQGRRGPALQATQRACRAFEQVAT
jgi:hypothetical protein